MCLDLNGLIDDASRRRLEAHYTFLGTFLHPTHNAMRNLHDQSNWHTNQTTVGMQRPYTQTARLLANVYVCHLLAGMLDEFAGLFERASPEYVKNARTADLRAATSQVEVTVNYFWFLFNDAPDRDKFNWAVHHASDDQLAQFDGYKNIPSELIPFDQHIYASLENGLRGWRNSRVGSYVPPMMREIKE